MITTLRRIKCDHCDHGVTDEFGEGDEYARKVMRNFGWSEDDEGDVCPDCAMKFGRIAAVLVPEERMISDRLSGRVFRITLDSENWYEAWYKAEDDTFRSGHGRNVVVARREDCKGIAFCNRT